MKLYLHYEPSEGDKTTTKLTVPKSWYTKPVSAVIGLFVESYNKKHADNPLEEAEVHLMHEGSSVYSDSIISEVLSEHGDYFIKLGAYVKARIAAVESTKLLKCKNYGCGKSFNEDENVPGACSHHCGPPVFHDTIKFWSCCKDRKAWDWESFQQLPTCSSGLHSTVDPKVALGSVRSAEEKDAAPQPVLKSIADFNTSNPEAVTAAQSALKTIVPAERKSTRAADGTAKCRNKGCQQVFNVSENGPSACRFHSGQAVFHDTLKYWSCCSDKKCYDFDDFVAVPGCMTGFHDDGVIELPADHGKA